VWAAIEPAQAAALLHETVLRASGSILDALNPVRNNASVAHPNQDLLGRDEAQLIINVGRSLLSYLDAQLGP